MRRRRPTTGGLRKVPVMGRIKGMGNGGGIAVLPRKLAEEGEGRKCTLKGGNATAQWAAGIARFDGLPEVGPAGTMSANIATHRWLTRVAPGALEHWRPTDERPSAARKSQVFVGGVRINNGRGSKAFDAILLDCTGNLIPVSLKGGETASDIALGESLEMVKEIVKAGAPFIVGVLSGGHIKSSFVYDTDEELRIPAPEGVRVRWVNLTPILAKMPTWDMVEADGVSPAYVRKHAAKAKGENGDTVTVHYPRLNVHFGRLDEADFSPEEPWEPGIMAP